MGLLSAAAGRAGEHLGMQCIWGTGNSSEGYSSVWCSVGACGAVEGSTECSGEIPYMWYSSVGSWSHGASAGCSRGRKWCSGGGSGRGTQWSRVGIAWLHGAVAECMGQWMHSAVAGAHCHSKARSTLGPWPPLVWPRLVLPSAT